MSGGTRHERRRQKQLEKATEHLRQVKVIDPDEHVEHVLTTQLTATPFSLLGLRLAPPRLVVATARSLVVLEAATIESVTSATDKRKLERDKPMGPLGDCCRYSRLFPDCDLWVDKRSYDDVEAMATGAVERDADDRFRAERRTGTRSNLLLLAALPFLALGAFDTLNAATQAYRFVGWLFLSAGVLALIASVALASPRLAGPRAERLAVVAGSAFAGFGAVVGAVLWSNGFINRKWWVDEGGGFVVLGPLAVLGAIAGLRRSAKPPAVTSREGNEGGDGGGNGSGGGGGSGTGTGSGRTEAVVKLVGSLGLGFGLLWSIFQFWYANNQELQRGAALTVAPVVKDIGPFKGQADRHAFSVDVALENPGKRNARIVDGVYVVELLKGSGHVARADIDLSLAVPESAYAGTRSGKVVEVGSLFDTGEDFEGGRKRTMTFVVSVPESELASAEVVRVSVGFVIGNGDRVTGVRPSLQRTGLGESATLPVVHRWTVAPLSLFRTMVSGRHAVVTYLYVPPGTTRTAAVGAAVMRKCVSFRGVYDPCAVKTVPESVEKFYGLRTVGGTFELPLPLADPASAP